MKLIFLVLLFFMFGFIQGEVIKKGQWLIEGKVPNHWMAHSVWGIFCVVTCCLIFDIITIYQWGVLFLVFLAAFPGIYLAGIKQWERCNLGHKIFIELKEIYQKLV